MTIVVVARPFEDEMRVSADRRFVVPLRAGGEEIHDDATKIFRLGALKSGVLIATLGTFQLNPEIGDLVRGDVAMALDQFAHAFSDREVTLNDAIQILLRQLGTILTSPSVGLLVVVAWKGSDAGFLELTVRCQPGQEMTTEQSDWVNVAWNGASTVWYLAGRAEGPNSSEFQTDESFQSYIRGVARSCNVPAGANGTMLLGDPDNLLVTVLGIRRPQR